MKRYMYSTFYESHREDSDGKWVLHKEAQAEIDKLKEKVFEWGTAYHLVKNNLDRAETALAAANEREKELVDTHNTLVIENAKLRAENEQLKSSMEGN